MGIDELAPRRLWGADAARRASALFSILGLGTGLLCAGCVDGSADPAIGTTSDGSSSTAASTAPSTGDPVGSETSSTGAAAVTTQAGSSTGISDTSGSGTTGELADACEDGPQPHFCDPTGALCLCPEAELGAVEYFPEIATGDVNGDGNVDLAFVREGGGVVVHLSDGESLGEAVLVGEGAPELISGEAFGIAYIDETGVLPRYGQVGSESLGTPLELGGAFEVASHVRAADFDGNGAVDLIAVTGDETSVWGTVQMNVDSGGEQVALDISPPGSNQSAVLTSVEDFDGDGTSDALVTPLYGVVQRIAFGSSTGLGEFSEVGGGVGVTIRFYPFEDGRGQTRFLQHETCGDCDAPFGSYFIYGQSAPGTFTILEEVAGERLNSTRKGVPLLGNGVAAIDTPQGVYAVSLAGVGTFGPGPSGAGVQFRDLHGANEPTPYSIIEGLDVSIEGRMPFADGDRVLALVGDFADQLVVFGLRTRN